MVKGKLQLNKLRNQAKSLLGVGLGQGAWYMARWKVRIPL